jgi:hypothetical protein
MDLRRQTWDLTQRQFADLSAVSELPGPKFVFAHFLLPHEPYVFDRQGNFIADEGMGGRSREEKYVEQLLFANRMLRQTLDKILSRQDFWPIIVLQADEGPWPENYSRNATNFDWLSATDRELEEKMNILNSYYLPGVDGRALYDTISPVNSFRVIFNSYFGTGLKLLPDEQYVFSSARNPYQWSKVGARLQR